jgi:hypothetical protein
MRKEKKRKEKTGKENRYRRELISTPLYQVGVGTFVT